jgi:acetyl-CoA C-acetyltransferase
MGVSVSHRGFFDPNFDYLSFKATKSAAKQAYEQAGIKNPRNEIDFAEVHDCFTMTEILNYEDLGFAERGEGWKLIVEGKTYLDGEIPVNSSGGLKSFGHPIGASGLRMVYEVVKQIQGNAEKRQLKKTDLALAHNLGGAGGVVSCVVVLGRR